jgi:hypothetical protein
MALQKKVKVRKTRSIREKDIDLDADEPTQEDIERELRLIAELDDYFQEDEE